LLTDFNPPPLARKIAFREAAAGFHAGDKLGVRSMTAVLFTFLQFSAADATSSAVWTRRVAALTNCYLAALTNHVADVFATHKT
jgi:hypothetical protein